jgi:ribosomal protein L11 methyltransferase
MIDWESQWASFAENFYDGKAHIDLTKFGGRLVDGPELLLLPGPGFGDLSHPTTYMMLKLMQGNVKGRDVLDIGCGSGILGLSALKLGASSLIGIDIDPEAIEHAKKNATLNRLKGVFSVEVPEGAPDSQILLMNMILSEQKMVMANKDKLNRLATMWIISGILESQRDEYRALTKTWGWQFKKEIRKGEWLGMVYLS